VTICVTSVSGEARRYARGGESHTGGSAVNAAVSGAAGPGMGERERARAHIPPHKRSRGSTGTEGTAQPRQRRRANQPNGVKSKSGSRQYRALRCRGRKQQRSVIYGFVLFIYGFVLFIYGFVLFRPDEVRFSLSSEAHAGVESQSLCDCQ
jgi:hypothetical protein